MTWDNDTLIALGKKVISEGREFTLSQNFQEAMKTLPEETAFFIFGYLENTIHHLNKFQGIWRVKMARTLIDQTFNIALTQSGLKMSCSKGCSFCCYQLVGMTENEAQAITANHKMKATMQQKHFASQVGMDTLDYAKQFPRGKCGFLESDGSCAVYEDRPLVCRTIHSVGKPEDCRIDSEKPTEFFVSMITEAILCAYWNSDGERMGTLPSLILGAL